MEVVQFVNGNVKLVRLVNLFEEGGWENVHVEAIKATNVRLKWDLMKRRLFQEHKSCVKSRTDDLR